MQARHVYLIRSLILFTVFLYKCETSAAQTSGDFRSFVLPSPNAMTFQKYVDYPVDYSTGVPQIDIPLYTVQLPD